MVFGLFAHKQLVQLFLGYDLYVVSGPVLTHCGLVMPYGDKDLGQHWLINGLLPGGTKSLH